MQPLVKSSCAVVAFVVATVLCASNVSAQVIKKAGKELSEWSTTDGKTFRGSFEYKAFNATTGQEEFSFLDDQGAWVQFPKGKLSQDSLARLSTNESLGTVAKDPVRPDLSQRVEWGGRPLNEMKHVGRNESGKDLYKLPGQDLRLGKHKATSITYEFDNNRLSGVSYGFEKQSFLLVDLTRRFGPPSSSWAAENGIVGSATWKTDEHVVWFFGKLDGGAILIFGPPKKGGNDFFFDQGNIGSSSRG